jgi:hypothetical protein
MSVTVADIVAAGEHDARRPGSSPTTGRSLMHFKSQTGRVRNGTTRCRSPSWIHRETTLTRGAARQAHWASYAGAPTELVDRTAHWLKNGHGYEESDHATNQPAQPSQH